jgi:peptide/nickel transport system substrate-binding protein
MRSTRRGDDCASLALLALACALFALGCRDPYPHPRFLGAGNETPRRGGTLRFAMDSDVSTADPALAQDTVALIVARLVYDGLVDYAPGSTAIVPALAERWEVSGDGLVYTFHLRPGARFSNGRTVTAQDFVYSWERLLNPHRIASPGAENYRGIDGYDDYREGRAAHLRGVAALDAHTLTVRLSKSDGTFLHVLAMRYAAPIPHEVVERIGDDRFGVEPVGAGAYRVERWEKGSRIVFRRNPHYWNAPRPWLDRIVFEESIARHLQFMRFVAGEMEYAHTYSLAAADLLWLSRNDAWRHRVVRTPIAAVGAFMMNTEMRPFDNVHVRRAVTFAIDREALSRARNRRILPAWSLYPPAIPGHRDDPPNRQRYDLDAARREMRSAGYPDGYPDEVDLWIGEGETGLLYGQIIQADLRRIGLRTRIRQASSSIYYSSLGRRHSIQMGFTAWNMDYPDPANFIEPNFHSRGIRNENSTNYSFYRNPALDDLLDRGRTEADPARRVAMYQEAEQHLLRDAPWAFLYNTVDVNVLQPYVRGWQHHPVWAHYVGDAWLDLPLRAWTESERSRQASFGPLAMFASPFARGGSR